MTSGDEVLLATASRPAPAMSEPRASMAWPRASAARARAPRLLVCVLTFALTPGERAFFDQRLYFLKNLDRSCLFYHRVLALRVQAPNASRRDWDGRRTRARRLVARPSRDCVRVDHPATPPSMPPEPPFSLDRALRASSRSPRSRPTAGQTYGRQDVPHDHVVGQTGLLQLEEQLHNSLARRAGSAREPRAPT